MQADAGNSCTTSAPLRSVRSTVASIAAWRRLSVDAIASSATSSGNAPAFNCARNVDLSERFPTAGRAIGELLTAQADIRRNL